VEMAGVPGVGDILIRTTTDDAGRPLTIAVGTGESATEALDAMVHEARDMISVRLRDPGGERLDEARWEVIGVRMVTGTAVIAGTGRVAYTAIGTLTYRTKAADQP
jgi:hypothetical protein